MLDETDSKDLFLKQYQFKGQYAFSTEFRIYLLTQVLPF